MNSRLLLFLSLFVSSLSIFAQPSFPPPSGVYCSCGPTTGNGYGSVNPSVAAKAFVQGILVRVSWEQIEPGEDTYDWSLIDGQITAAKQYGKKISLAIGTGRFVPDWLFDKGILSTQVLIPNTNDTIAIPWDSTYLVHWTDFISALGAKYENDTIIQLVYITNSSSNGYEMQLPFSCNPSLADLAYTDQKMIDSWKTAIKAFGDAFPNHYLTNDFHPVNGSDIVADSVYTFAKQEIGLRYGANAWWWTQKNTGVYPAQYQILLNSTSENSFTGVQFANSGTKDSAAFGAGGMPEALARAMQDHVCYWEIWNDDILNPDFEQLLSNASCLNTSVSKLNYRKIKLYPNPNSGQLTIDLPDNLSEQLIMNLYTMDGSLKFRIHQKYKSHIQLNLQNLNAGIYILEISDGNALFREKLIKN